MKTKDGVEFAGATDPGYRRKNNEDNFAVEPDLGLLVVADGMGGHNSGEVASDISCKTIIEYARKMLGGEKNMVPEGGRSELTPRGRQLEFFIKSANTVIYEKGRAFPKDAGMGTTIVAALLDSKSMTVAHVGDSRLYLWRLGALTQLTEDHSFVGEQVKHGRITSDEAARSSMQNMLTRALGADKDVQVDISDHPLLPEDIVLLATDGLSKMLLDTEVASVIAVEQTPQKITDSLIAKSLAAGGVDNIAIVVAKVPSAGNCGFKKLAWRLLGR